MARRPRALCTREEAKRLLPNYVEPTDPAEQTRADAFFDDAIDAASQRIYEVSGREFLAFNDPGTQSSDDWPTPAPVARDLDVQLNATTPADPGYGSRRARLLKVGDLARLDAIAYGTAWNSARYTLDVATYVIARPRVRAPWAPIRYLEIQGDVWASQVYTVTGVWGFPDVPADVRRACAIQAAIWASSDLANFSKTFLAAAAAGSSPSEPRSLAQEVFDVAFSYNVPEVG